MKQTVHAPVGAYFDGSGPAVVIEDLTIYDPTVVSEARRWSSGKRGAAASADDMAGTDLSAFVTQAVIVGAHAIGSAGGAQESFNLEQLVSDVGSRTAEAAERAAKATNDVVTGATTVVERASVDAKKAITEAGTMARQAFAENVNGVSKTLQEEIRRLVGGDNPELLVRLTPILDKFGAELDERVSRHTNELLARAVKQFDPDDPTSPMAKHARELQRQQDALSSTLEKNHKSLEAKLIELDAAIKVSQSAKDAATATAGSTPLKGGTYEAEVRRLMEDVAAGLGDEYVDTSSTAGALSRNKKGDGVLLIDGGATRVVLEMTDSQRPSWNDYLAEAERNREAVASLGLVRTADQLNGASVRCLGPRRIVLAFDPNVDDPELLRTVVQLLRISAVVASARRDAGEIHTADEKIREALALLTKIDDIQKTAGLIRNHASKIDQGSEAVRTALARLLGQAQAALSAAVTESEEEAA